MASAPRARQQHASPADDGWLFVGQLQADIQHARIAEYTNGISPPAELAIMDREILRDRSYGLRLRFVGDHITL